MARSQYQTIPARTWARVRRRILDRDGWRCRECGCPGRLECHHVIPLEKGGAPLDDSNLLTLCRGCHIEKHIREKERDPARREWRAYLRELAGGNPSIS